MGIIEIVLETLYCVAGGIIFDVLWSGEGDGEDKNRSDGDFIAIFLLSIFWPFTIIAGLIMSIIDKIRDEN